MSIDEVIDGLVKYSVDQSRANKSDYMMPFDMANLLVLVERSNNLKIDRECRLLVIDKIKEYSIFDVVEEASVTLFLNANTYKISSVGYIAWIGQKEEFEKLDREGKIASLKNAIHLKRTRWIAYVAILISFLALIVAFLRLNK